MWHCGRLQLRARHNLQQIRCDVRCTDCHNRHLLEELRQRKQTGVAIGCIENDHIERFLHAGASRECDKLKQTTRREHTLADFHLFVIPMVDAFEGVQPRIHQATVNIIAGVQCSLHPLQMNLCKTWRFRVHCTAAYQRNFMAAVN